jgi:hypothetical protein
MLGITQDQQSKLEEIANSMQETGYGHYWPEEYKDFSQAWGYFNSIYNLLYKDHAEWQRIARFAIDSRFQHIWYKLCKLKSVRELAKQPCVGDGRDSFRPTERVQIAFNTLRAEYGFSVKTPCRKAKCKTRGLAGWPTCLLRTWPAAPQAITSPDDAKFTPLGATLVIVYQIRNNLFHGSKDETFGSEYERNRLLIQISLEIVKTVLHEVEGLI